MKARKRLTAVGHRVPTMQQGLGINQSFTVEEMCGFLVLDGLTTFDGEENVFFTIPSLCYIFFCIFRSNSASVCFLKVLATALSGDCLQRISTSLCEPLDKAANTGN